MISVFLKFFIFLILAAILASCTDSVVGGKYQENLAKLDKLYGYCDNPQRNIKKRSMEYTNCKRKEAAAGADGIIDDTATIPFADLFNKDKNNGGAALLTNINQDLWKGSLQTLDQYPLKIADSVGGYIETDWIYDQNNPNERCSIKVQILSASLISTGVDVKLICSTKKNDQWILKDQDYTEEQKQLHLKILEQAQQSYQTSL